MDRYLCDHLSFRQICPAGSLEREFWATGEGGLLVCLGMGNSCDVEVEGRRVVVGGGDGGICGY